MKDEIQQEIVVHRFRLADVSDFDIYLNQAVDRFYESDKGQWLLQRQIPMRWSATDTFDYYHDVAFLADMNEETAFLYKLTHGNDNKHMAN